jgi:NADH-quinone oxidoreductase subunit J
MQPEIILFYSFGFLAIINGVSVITAKNPVHSVFYLVLSFISASLLLILLGVEFLPVVFMIVYVGAIAILFLFVVMMLNIKLVEILDNSTRYAPVGFIIGFLFFTSLVSILDQEILIWDVSSHYEFSSRAIAPVLNATNMASVLYTDHFTSFIIASLVLLVAMVGAILLTVFHEKSVKRQDIFVQISRDINSVKLVS